MVSENLKVVPPNYINKTDSTKKRKNKIIPESPKEKSNKMPTKETKESVSFPLLIQWLEQNKKVNLKSASFNDANALEAMNWKNLEENKLEVIPQLKAYQRLLKILPEKNHKLILKLLEANIHSAIQVASMSKREFLASYAKIFTSKKFTAEIFYNKASAIKTKLMLNHVRRIS